MTPETRQLLEGDEKREARNLPRMGWGDATTAPPIFASRIAEIRSALLAGRPIPAPSAAYRSAALAAEKTLFPTRTNQRAEQPADKRTENLRALLSKASIF